MSRTLALAPLFLVLAACNLGGDTGAAGTDAPRGPIGKADSDGTCAAADGADFCGGKSEGNCWCDDLCAGYGDCCSDKEPVCDAPPPPTTTDRQVEVLFTAPFCDLCSYSDKSVLLARSAIIKRVVGLLDGATTSVDVAQFTFSRREIEAAIVRANDRGVTVRVAMDKAQDRSGSLSRRLADAGVDVRFIAGKGSGSYTGLQHAKFMLVDGGTLLTGSNNWSSTGTSINAENTMVITASPTEPQIAGFACHFAAIWAGDTSAAGACSTDGLAFTPGSAARIMLRDAIRASTASVDVLMQHFTFSDLVKELAKAQERGVAVRVIVNVADRAEHTGDSWDRLLRAGGRIRYKQNNEAAYQLMHHKLAIVDGITLYNGSGNWSGSGFYRNFENYVRYQEPQVVRAFVDEYARLWTWALSGSSLDAGLSAAEQHADDTVAYFGNLHAHFSASSGSKLLDDGKGMVLDDEGNQIPVAGGVTTTQSAELAFEYARDIAGLDFLALTPHCSNELATDGDNMPNMSAEGFQALRGAADGVTDSSRGAFLALAGMEWSTNSTGNHVNIVGSSAIAKIERGAFDALYDDFLPGRVAAGDRPFVMFNHPRTHRMNADTLGGSWDQVYGVNLADIPKSGERKKKFNDFGLDDFLPLRDVRDSWLSGEVMPDETVVNDTLANIASAASPYLRLMEVTLGRGTELGRETAMNPSMSTTEDGGLERRTKVHTDWDYYLLRGFRAAPTASHDNHWSNWGTGHTSRTGVLAPSLSRKSLMTAIDRRQVFASEDENLAVRLYAGGRVPMGSSTATTSSRIRASLQLSDPDYSGAYEVRVYVGRVGGAEVTLARTTSRTGNGWVEFDVSLTSGVQFFYVEIFEVDADRMAWSAPIWVEKL